MSQIGCTRCGATIEGDEITPDIKFKFPHESGCGAKIGIITIVGGVAKSQTKEQPEEAPKEETPVEEPTVEAEATEEPEATPTEETDSEEEKPAT